MFGSGGDVCACFSRINLSKEINGRFVCFAIGVHVLWVFFWLVGSDINCINQYLVVTWENKWNISLLKA